MSYMPEDVTKPSSFSRIDAGTLAGSRPIPLTRWPLEMAYSAQGWPTIPVIPVIKINMAKDRNLEDCVKDAYA